MYSKHTLALIVTSDRVYRGEKHDEVRPVVEELIKNKHANLKLVYYRVVPNKHSYIRNAVLEAVEASDLVIVSGGTGISPRDVSIEAVAPLARKEIPGFGELHRRLSMEQIGPRALLSRTAAYIIGNSLVAVTPGNPQAVKLALDILSQVIEHATEEIRGKGHRHHKQ
ncbi:MAG: molybdenum cofactor biosynthesis protein MoaB [Desulfurococcales archaeon]|nr:molybdenum cofactor biosynthesis protein MoaB [Desulfurococcales archaeon]